MHRHGRSVALEMHRGSLCPNRIFKSLFLDRHAEQNRTRYFLLIQVAAPHTPNSTPQLCAVYSRFIHSEAPSLFQENTIVGILSSLLAECICVIMHILRRRDKLLYHSCLRMRDFHP